MKQVLIKALIILLIFVVAAFLTLLTFIMSQGGFSNTTGLDKAASLIVTFGIFFGLTWGGLLVFQKNIGSKVVLITMVVVLITLIVLNLTGATIKFTYKIAPYYITWILGVIAGQSFYLKNSKRFGILIVLSIFPISMAFGAYNLWFHRIEYGNWTGVVSEQKVATFELTNKAEEAVNNETLKGKIVLFDFWFVSCGPCWSKFPELQQLYEKYESNPAVEIYAVNRPMKSDKPDALFTRIEDKSYTFPVLKGTQQIMDELGVYKYPTVMILNQKGEMVFMGELEDSKKKIEELLKPARN